MLSRAPARGGSSPLLDPVQVVPHTVRRGDPESLPDFTNCGRPALLAEGPRDHVEDGLVAVGPSLYSGEPLGLTLPGAPRRLGWIGLAHDTRIVHICAVVKRRGLISRLPWIGAG